MAVNVYLTFYYKYDAQKLRKMEIPYLLCCYGIPFIVALTYIFIKTESKGRMYGNATIWCWVSTPWDIWRIVTFYGPVWYVRCRTWTLESKLTMKQGGDGRNDLHLHPRRTRNLHQTSAAERSQLHIALRRRASCHSQPLQHQNNRGDCLRVRCARDHRPLSSRRRLQRTATG